MSARLHFLFIYGTFLVVYLFTIGTKELLIMKTILILFIGLAFWSTGKAQSNTERLINKIPKDPKAEIKEVHKSNSEWEKILSKDQYRILREKGTEFPWANKYNKEKTVGTYVCAACGNPLYRSETKYESGSGWPSFYAPISNSHVDYEIDKSLFMTRTEVVCAACESHLGHVFDDGPNPTGLRYCMNSAAMTLIPDTAKTD